MQSRTTYCGLVTEALMGKNVTLCGWVNRRRDHGGVIFVDLRDREGYVQVVCDPDRADMFKTAEGLRNEFCVQVKGLVRARPQGTANDNMRSGKIEVLCQELLMVAGYDRYYQITKCFRDEDLRADRQPEFTQIDVETSFMTEEEIRTMFEGMIRSTFQNVLGVDIGAFPVMKHADAMRL